MLFLISTSPIFEKWLDGVSLRSGLRSNSICPAKNAADWFNLPEVEDECVDIDEHDTASQSEM